MTPMPPPPLSQLPRPTSPSEGAGAGHPLQTCPAFEPRRLEREIAVDRLMRWGVLTAVLLTIFLLQGSAALANLWVLVLPLMIAWIFLNASNARVMATLPALAAAMEQDPPAAEAMIAQSLARRPLHRQMRYELYHRLAILRMRQMRLGEVASIAATLLAQPLGAGERHRPSLLLMLAEASMLQHDLHTAYGALAQLAQPAMRRRLSLVEQLQHLAIRTRYEVVLGYDGLALAGLPAKLRLVRMMPASACGQMHQLWAVAAWRMGDRPLHEWMLKRAELLCEPAQFQAFQQGLASSGSPPGSPGSFSGSFPGNFPGGFTGSGMTQTMA